MRCRIDVAPLRSGPRDDAEQVTQALRHEPLRVMEERDGWARVVTAYEYPGWIRASALEPGQGELPRPSATNLLEAARAYLGAPYEWGGMTKAGIDCSGLVHMAYRQTGVLVPRDSRQQEAAGLPVPSGEERAGDVIVYGAGKRADHVSFFCGAGMVLHATGRDGLGVVEEPEPGSLQVSRRAVIRLRELRVPE